MRNPKFEIYKSPKDGQYYFRLRAQNGEIILSGQGYTEKRSCQNGVESVKENAPIDSRYEKKESANEKYYFILKAANSQQIGKSQMYTSSSSRDKGIATVQRNAPQAPVEEIES